jgi:hypothetical protein
VFESVVSGILVGVKAMFGRMCPGLVYGAEADKQDRFSRRVYLVLRASGWYPGRRVEFSSAEYIYVTHDAAFRVFQEFGDLRFPDVITEPSNGSFIVGVGTPYTLDPDPIADWLDAMSAYGLYSIGSLNDVDELWIDIEGAVYAREGMLIRERRRSQRIVAFAGDFDEALELCLSPTRPKDNLIVKRRAFEEIDGIWRSVELTL